MSVDNNSKRFENYAVRFEQIENVTDVPEWATMLIGCVRNLIDEIKSLSLLQSENIQEVESQNLVEENMRLRDEIKILKNSVDHNEQVSRLSNLLIHGVPDDTDDNTDDICIKIINEKLKIPISKVDIAKSHKLGPVKKKVLTRNSKPPARPIIIKFESLQKKLDVFRAKRLLKGSNLVITENLTKARHDLYKSDMLKYRKAMYGQVMGKF